ncbi:hypothetical protein FQA39_LY17811 [Lamprigera yunnana]|nr:hypothetical protein FQA39_LY17811 [Lamprigera yunnana]
MTVSSPAPPTTDADDFLSSSDSETEITPTTPAAHAFPSRYVPMNKWGLKFSGDGTMSVNVPSCNLRITSTWLLEEILRCTMGPPESLGFYVAAAVSTLISRLSTPLTENQKQLTIILRNFTPCFQTQLALVDITSAEELLRIGKKIRDK